MEAACQDGQWDAVYCSPLQRCALFAQRVAEQHQIPVHIDNRLTEINFGVWEGLEIDRIMASNPEALQRYWSDPTSEVPEGGESVMQLSQRVIESIGDLRVWNRSKHLLLVTHGGVIRAILAWVLAMPLSALIRIEVTHGGLSRIRIPDQGNPSLIFHGGGALC